MRGGEGEGRGRGKARRKRKRRKKEMKRRVISLIEKMNAKDKSDISPNKSGKCGLRGSRRHTNSVSEQPDITRSLSLSLSLPLSLKKECTILHRTRASIPPEREPSTY